MVILDDDVLDLTLYLNEHPGGRFSLEHNIGRDITKFFYGAYSLENIDRIPIHKHSNDAFLIVKDLSIGKLEGLAPN